MVARSKNRRAWHSPEPPRQQEPLRRTSDARVVAGVHHYRGRKSQREASGEDETRSSIVEIAHVKDSETFGRPNPDRYLGGCSFQKRSVTQLFALRSRTR